MTLSWKNGGSYLISIKRNSIPNSWTWFQWKFLFAHICIRAIHVPVVLYKGHVRCLRIDCILLYFCTSRWNIWSVLWLVFVLTLKYVLFYNGWGTIIYKHRCVFWLSGILGTYKSVNNWYQNQLRSLCFWRIPVRLIEMYLLSFEHWAPLNQLMKCPGLTFFRIRFNVEAKSGCNITQPHQINFLYLTIPQ